ncbi:MAG: hypothetical protein CYG59_12535 [Chloroflexi bacterium]|nr:MAG: hypothetical protein CYG59_12535 [Chloroflexota bacterium]
MHPVEFLVSALTKVAPYPKGVVPVPKQIAGTAFFPGGSGLWQPNGSDVLPHFPVGKVMVLGHDFHSEIGYHQSLAKCGENLKGPTWRNLLKLLREADIEPEQCFFTNAYMGLRAGSNTTGKFPGAYDADFVERCRSFLAEQIAVQQPRLILTLGNYVPSILASLSTDLGQWRKNHSLIQLDALGVPIVTDVRFHEDYNWRTAVVALTHPSLRPANIGRRHYRELRGNEAEVAMVREAINVSGIELNG